MLQCWTSRLCSLLLAAALLTTAYAQAPLADAVASTDAQAALDHGLKLERDRRWGEALQYYEQAVKDHPNRRDLEERLVLARSHYDVSRRYGDDSFIRG